MMMVLGLKWKTFFFLPALIENMTLKDTGSIIFFNQDNDICSRLTRIRKFKNYTQVYSVIGEGNGTPLQYSCLEKSDMAEWLHFHFSVSFIGEGNGNPLQCSCLENPRDGGAWWAAIYGVTQSRTRLKRLSSSSILSYTICFSYKDLPSQFARNSIKHKVSNSWRSLPSAVGLEVMGKIRGRLYSIKKKSNEHINSGPL